MGALIDLSAFSNRVSEMSIREPARAATAGRALIDGAIRIRRGGDGIFGDAERPVTKPAEAVAAWIGGMQRELAAGGAFHRHAELREALVAAAEEVDGAAAAMPKSRRLQSALYSDAIGAIDDRGSVLKSALPWIISAGVAGVLIGVLISRK